MNLKLLLSSLPLAVILLASTQPAVAACAPTSGCAGTSCWNNLLNNSDFDGSTCNPGWTFQRATRVASSTGCSSMPDKVAILSTVGSLSGGGDSFSQIFYVPGSPGQYVTLGTTLKRTEIRTDLGPFSCHREDYRFTGYYGGQNLRLRVYGQIVSSGVEYHVDWIQIFQSL